MPEPIKHSSRYMPGLDGLRAVAVAAVVAYHLGVGWAPGGLLGVGVFFTLSGYLITDLLLAAWYGQLRMMRDIGPTDPNFTLRLALEATTIGTFVAAAKVIGTAPDLSLKIDYTAKTPGGYPIDLVTYELACTKYASAATGALVKSFLTFTSSAAQQATLPNQGYVPLPASILTQVQALVATIS